MKIGKHTIRKGVPYIIAEAGINHNGNLRTAIAMVEAAKEAGADAVKFQLFNPEKMWNRDQKNRDMLKWYVLPADSWWRLQHAARDAGIDYGVSVFDADSLDVALQGDDPNFIKIAHSEICNIELLRYVAKNAPCPVIMSLTGENEAAEKWAVEELGRQDLALLYCVPKYPASVSDFEYADIRCMGITHNLPCGFSDHTDCGPEVADIAVGAGAAILEKHFTLDRKQKDADHHMSFEPQELAEYARRARGAR